MATTVTTGSNGTILSFFPRLPNDVKPTVSYALVLQYRPVPPPTGPSEPFPIDQVGQSDAALPVPKATNILRVRFQAPIRTSALATLNQDSTAGATFGDLADCYGVTHDAATGTFISHPQDMNRVLNWNLTNPNQQLPGLSKLMPYLGQHKVTLRIFATAQGTIEIYDEQDRPLYAGAQAIKCATTGPICIWSAQMYSYVAGNAFIVGPDRNGSKTFKQPIVMNDMQLVSCYTLPPGTGICRACPLCPPIPPAPSLWANNKGLIITVCVFFTVALLLFIGCVLWQIFRPGLGYSHYSSTPFHGSHASIGAGVGVGWA